MFFISGFTLLLNLIASGQKIIPFYGPFPEPAPNKNMLFYLQRTVDRNTVIYELNFGADGQLNNDKPVKVYWIDFENGAKKSSLTFAQSKFAYGIESEEIEKSKNIYVLNLVSYKKIKLYLKPQGKDNNYQVHTLIKGKPAVLKRIFVNITGGSYLKPVVSYIELSGNDLKQGLPVAEQFKPGKD